MPGPGWLILFGCIHLEFTVLEKRGGGRRPSRCIARRICSKLYVYGYLNGIRPPAPGAAGAGQTMKLPDLPGSWCRFRSESRLCNALTRQAPLNQRTDRENTGGAGLHRVQALTGKTITARKNRRPADYVFSGSVNHIDELNAGDLDGKQEEPSAKS